MSQTPEEVQEDFAKFLLDKGDVYISVHIESIEGAKSLHKALCESNIFDKDISFNGIHWDQELFNQKDKELLDKIKIAITERYQEIFDSQCVNIL